MGLDTLTRAGPGQTEKNKKMRQSKCGEARDYMAYGSTRHNVEYAEVNPRNTSKMCFMCYGYNTLREDRKLTCHAHVPNLGDRYRHIHQLALIKIIFHILQKSGTLARATRQWGMGCTRRLRSHDAISKCAKMRTLCPPML